MSHSVALSHLFFIFSACSHCDGCALIKIGEGCTARVFCWPGQQTNHRTSQFFSFFFYYWLIYRFDVFLDSVKLLFEWQKKTSLKLTNKSFISEQKKIFKKSIGSILERNYPSITISIETQKLNQHLVVEKSRTQGLDLEEIGIEWF